MPKKELHIVSLIIKHECEVFLIYNNLFHLPYLIDYIYFRLFKPFNCITYACSKISWL